MLNNQTNLFPKKYLGQNFLVNKRIKQRIIQYCELQKEDIVVEIGPGLGALTEEIIGHVSQLFAIDKDKRFIQALINKFQIEEKDQNNNIKFIQADFLKFDLSTFSKRIKIIGNVPYNISSPIIQKLVENKEVINKIFLTVQLEFGQRLMAKPNTENYGALSCFVQYHFKPNLLFKIPNTCFYPIPKVDSCFVELLPFSKGELKINEKLLFRIIQTAFQQRRKKIINSLSVIIEKECLKQILIKLNIQEDLRAENLSLNDYLNITTCYSTIS